MEDGSSGISRSGGFDAERLSRMRDAWQEEIDAKRLPGAVMLLHRDGETALRLALGRRAPDSDDPMRVDSLFRIFSMTKPIVSVAAMMLVEQGRLRLAEPITKWLPMFARMKVAVRSQEGELQQVPAAQPIRLHDLLRHTAGFTYEFMGNGPVQKLYAEARLHDRSIGNAEMVRRLADLPLYVQPGTRWDYGLSTDVLGHLLEVACDQPLGDLLARMVLDPLGMADTGFDVPPSDAHRIAEPLARDPYNQSPVRLYEPTKAPQLQSGGGGLISTADDYGRFLRMLLGGGRSGDVRLLGSRTVAYMSADHLGDLAIRSPYDMDLLPPGHGFGLGFAVRRSLGGAPYPGSPGSYFWGGMAATQFWVDPAERMFAVLMIQAPNQRRYFHHLFRQMVYAALDD